MQPLLKTVWSFLKNLKIGSLYDPANALLGICPKDTNIVIQRGTCTPIFIAAMSIRAKICKEPRCSSKGEEIKKMWDINTKEYYSAIKKNENLPFATVWIELEDIMQSVISQSLICRTEETKQIT